MIGSKSIRSFASVAIGIVLGLSVALAYWLGGWTFAAGVALAYVVVAWLLLSKVETSVQSLVAFLAIGVLCLPLTGCTPAEQKKVKDTVALVGAEVPKVLPLLAMATAAADSVLPADALIITGVSATISGGLIALAALCNQYAAAPSDSIWQSIVATVDTLVKSGSAGLLDAAHITNLDSRAKATAVLGAIQTALLIIDSLVQRSQTSAQIQSAALNRPIKLWQEKPYLDREMVARETGHPFGVAYGYETALGF